MESDVHFLPLLGTSLRQDLSWWDIYRQSFPPDERSEAEPLLATVHRGDSLAFAARHRDTTIGMALVLHLHAVPCSFLAYFAIAQEWRARRIGGRFFSHLCEASAQNLLQMGVQTLGMTMEVEDPHDPVDPGERRVREKRIRFYERQEAHLLADPYRMPPLAQRSPPPMKLMLRPSGAEQALTVKDIAPAIYDRWYRDVAGVSPAELDRYKQELLHL